MMGGSESPEHVVCETDAFRSLVDSGMLEPPLGERLEVFARAILKTFPDLAGDG
jgi:hypothetical protein